MKKKKCRRECALHSVVSANNTPRDRGKFACTRPAFAAKHWAPSRKGSRQERTCSTRHRGHRIGAARMRCGLHRGGAYGLPCGALLASSEGSVDGPPLIAGRARDDI